MHKKLSLSSVLFLSLLLPACGGDDPVGDDSGTETGDESEASSDATGDGDSGDGDTSDSGDGDTSDSGDGDSGDGDSGDGDSGDGDSGDGDSGDGDGDGDGDSGDGDGDGDAPCDLGFSTLITQDPLLTTRLTVEGIISCDKDIDLVPTGGEVCVNETPGGDWFYTFRSVLFEDLPPTTCGLANVGFQNLEIEGIGNETEVVVPAANGMMTGNQPIQVRGQAYGDAPLIGEIEPTDVEDFVGILPEGDATVSDTDTSVVYDDDQTVIATADPEVGGQQLTVTLTGLQGQLDFTP